MDTAIIVPQEFAVGVVAHRCHCSTAIITQALELGLTLDQIEEVGVIAHRHHTTMRAAVKLVALVEYIGNNICCFSNVSSRY